MARPLDAVGLSDSDGALLPRMQLSGRVIAITGGARGIGLATAKRAAAAGAKVAIGDFDETTASSTGFFARRLDVRDEESFRDFLQAVIDEFGGLDVLINNAGIMSVGPLLEETTETAQRMVDVNVHGVLIGTKLGVPLISGRPGGRIVNIASYAGKLAVPGEPTYAATKAAVIAFTDGARWELERHGVGFTTVLPSFTNTELIAGTAPVKSLTPIEPDDVAKAIIRAIENDEDEVYVPKSVKPVGATFGLLPRRWRQRLYHRLGLDRAFIDVDPARRKAYTDRTDALGKS